MTILLVVTIVIAGYIAVLGLNRALSWNPIEKGSPG
jgi:hypothetical protein